jgi:glycosyltransferase involved in cell wall biosynthesis
MGEKPRVAVCAAQTPFLNGGAELHVQALARELKARGYPVSIISLPFTWDKAELLQNALLWRLVRIPADLAIVTNFPSYFLQHGRKVLWLFHQHRALYELYGTSLSDWGSHPDDAEVRRVIVAADTRFISETRRRFTTSQNVSSRLRRYNGLESEPLYHPPPLHRFLVCRSYDDFILMPTRLESHKRPGLLIEALRHTRSGVRAVVVGQGPEEDALRDTVERYGMADRVEFTGYVDDKKLLELYASCAAVFYAPFDEDYGYVTLEAFWARKPVVTTTDAGGVLEFVEDDVTGLVAAPEPERLGACIDRLAESEPLCRRLGDAGFEKVRRISWDSVIGRLVDEA